MNAPPSEGSESTIDIFVLSKNQTEVPARMAPLEQKGYRITLFDDPPTLIESLHEGKPNLLICDTLSFPEAYDLCRHIKDDTDLWVIPVLILTAASDLSDLLHILDCNADNYIAYPYDPEYFLSLVDGILSTPVERQTPEQIKTQFKIQHDDRIFVVTADRRKLLEFLLSSFEIAVSKFQDLSRATDEIHVLSDDVNRLGMFVDGQKQTVEELNSSLREKVQAIKTLEQTRNEQEQALLDKTGEIDRLARDLEADKALLGAAEDQLRALIRNKDESERQSVAEISDLRQQVTSLAAELGTATATLQESRNAHSLEQSGRAEAMASLAEITQGKELAEKSVRALTLDNEQMKVSLAAEKNRAVAAEQETRSVLLAKSGSEQDLTAIINDLRETAKQQALDLHRQKAEMDDAKNQVLNLEIQMGNLKTDKENAESVLRATTGHLQQDLAITREKLDAAEATLDEKDLEIERLNVSYNEILGERDKAGSELQSLTRELRAAQAARDNKDLEIERLNVSYNEILGERDKAGSELQALSGELRNVQQALDAEKEHHHATEESLNAVIRERDAALQSLQGSHQSAQADLAEHRDNLAQVRLDLASASAGSSALENERRLHNSTVESLRSSALETERCGQDLGKLSEQLAAVQSSRASEKELRSAAESETEDLRRKLVAAEDRSRSQDASVAATIETLKAELSSASHWQEDLEHRVQGLTREKQLAEEKAGSLAAEIEQARVALADEWVDHMNAREQLTAAAHEKQQLEKSLSRAEEPEAEKARKRAIIIKGPDLPMEIRAVSHALTTPGNLHVPPPDTKRITGVEDLFEDDDVTEDPGTTPTVSIIQEPSGDPDWVPPMPDLSQFPGEIQSPPYGEGLPGDRRAVDPEVEGTHDVSEEEGSEDEDSDGEVTGDGYPDDGTNGADEDAPGDSPASGPAGESAESITPALSFNRAQWFDLLKWAHHSGALTPEQRMQIVRMGRLIQKGRKLTRKQDEQVREMIVLVQTLGYRFT